MEHPRFTYILIPLPLPSLPYRPDEDPEILPTSQQRITRLTDIDRLWNQRFTEGQTQRIWCLFQEHTPAPNTTPTGILRFWAEWEHLRVFDSILCVTSPQLPNHYVLLAQSESKRWALAYWGPTELDALTESRLPRWLSTPLLGILMSYGWGLAGLCAMIAFIHVLDESRESVDLPITASLLLYGGIICGLLTITIEPALQWLTTRLFARPQYTNSSESDTIPSRRKPVIASYHFHL